MYSKNNHLLISKMILINGSLFLLLIYSMYMNLYDLILQSDPTKITFVIIGLTLFGVLLSIIKGFKFNYYLIQLNRKNDTKITDFVIKMTDSHLTEIDINNPVFRKNLEISLSEQLTEINFISKTLPLLGLIGTIIGFVIILSISPDVILNITPEKIPELIVELLSGLGIALYTTLAGACGYLWVAYNLHILKRSSMQIYRQLILYYRKLERK